MLAVAVYDQAAATGGVVINGRDGGTMIPGGTPTNVIKPNAKSRRNYPSAGWCGRKCANRGRLCAGCVGWRRFEAIKDAK